jgi:hypothetical protein
MSKGTCSYVDCARPEHSRGFCGRHYQQERKARRLPVVQRHRPRRSRAGGCEVDGCSRPVHAQGLCGTHDSVRRRNGHPTRYRRAEWAGTYHAHGGFKVCTLCEERKAVSEFFLNKSTQDGLQPRCKLCAMRLEREDRAARPEAYRERRRQYYTANADRQRENTRAWRLANYDRARAYDREYNQK